MTDPRPWFAFWAADFWASPAVRKMSLDAAGLYLALLCDQWTEGGPISADEAVWRASYAHRCSSWEAAWAAVRPCFAEVDGGLMVNPRLEREREVADTFRAKLSEAGKRGAAIRWGSPGQRVAIASDSTRQDRDRDRTGQKKKNQTRARPRASDSAPRRRLYDDPPLAEFGIDTPEMRAAFAELRDYRRERHLSRWVDRTVRANLKEWAEWGAERAAAAIAYSIRKQWDGVFEEKSRGGSSVNGVHIPPPRLTNAQAALARVLKRRSDAATSPEPREGRRPSLELLSGMAGERRDDRDLPRDARGPGA